MNNKVITLLVACLLCAGCATPQSKYGIFYDTQNDNIKYTLIVDDVVKQLRNDYAPAHTLFNIEQNSNEPFGYFLVLSLRKLGYAVHELSAENKTPALAKGINLNYTVDNIANSENYIVKIKLNNGSMHRAYYKYEDGVVLPAGDWTKIGL